MVFAFSEIRIAFLHIIPSDALIMTMMVSNRVQAIDVLRGFALMCILLVHSAGEFAGWSSIYSSPVIEDTLATSPIDSMVNFTLNLLLVSKSRALFAFLLRFVEFLWRSDDRRQMANHQVTKNGELGIVEYGFISIECSCLQ